MTIWLGGMMLSPLAGFMASDRFQAEGKILVGLAFATGAFALGMLVNAFSCHSTGMGEIYCPPPFLRFLAIGGSIAGLAFVGLLVLVLLRTRRGRARRSLLLLAALLAVAVFSPAALSIGPFLLLVWWGILGWIIVSNPPLRVAEVPAGLAADGFKEAWAVARGEAESRHLLDRS
jgi:hypothetical protein